MALDVTTPHAFNVRAAPTNPAPVSTSPHAVILVPVPGGQGPRGLPGDGVPVVGQALTGVKDSVNTVFTTASAFRTGTTAVYLNGLREFHYSETGANTITLEDPPLSGDDVRIDYIIV